MADVISLNAGDYWIGDPRYALDEATVSSLVKEAHEKEKEAEFLFKSGSIVIAYGNFHHDGTVFIGGTTHEINITTGLVAIIPKSSVAQQGRALGVFFKVEDGAVNVSYTGQSSILVGNLVACSPKSIDEAY